MIYIVLTANGLENILSALNKPGELWLVPGVTDDNFIAKLRASGWGVTIWTHTIDFSNKDELETALTTVREHHPEQSIWLEA